MEDGLVRVEQIINIIGTMCLNPCFNGRWSRTNAGFETIDEQRKAS